MTNHQSNIIFYTVISIIVTGIIIHANNPDFFGDLGKSKEALLLKNAVSNGDYNQALTSYRSLVNERISNGKEFSAETAIMYEDMAKIYYSLGNPSDAKTYYLNSLDIREQLARNDVFAYADTYYQLGVLSEEKQQYNQALTYFEKALSKRLGNTTDDEPDGFTVGMHKSRLNHLRLNNAGTIDTLKKLAEMHIIKNDHTTAKSYFERALTASKTVYGENDDQTKKLTNTIQQLGNQ